MGIGYFITTKIQSISNPTQTQLKYLHVQKTANHLFLPLLSIQPSRKRNHPNPKKIMGIGYFITTKIQSISNPTQPKPS